jgi:hypothetical protein
MHFQCDVIQPEESDRITLQAFAWPPDTIKYGRDKVIVGYAGQPSAHEIGMYDDFRIHTTRMIF